MQGRIREGQGKSLVEAYKVAAEGNDLQHFKEMLRAHDDAIREDERLQAEYAAEKEAEKAAKAEKKKRKSEVKVDEDVEMEDAETAPKKSSKKRKKGAESDDEEPEKPAKTPKTTKIKLNTGKTPSTDKKTEKKTPKAKSEKKKKAQESEEEVDEGKPLDEAPLDPVEARKAREKEVLFLRHKLQKGFLSRDQEPAEAEMPQMASFIKKLEAYNGDLEVGIIRKTKINKVLKGIVKLNSIPKDEEYHFRERSVKLLGEWNVLLGAEPAEAEKGESAKEEKDSPTTTNGVHKEVEEKAEEKVEQKVEEPESNTLPAEEAVEKISAEVEADAGEKVAAIDEIDKLEEPVEEVKTESAAAPTTPAVEDKAPASAAGAAEATEVVKDTE